MMTNIMVNLITYYFKTKEEAYQAYLMDKIGWRDYIDAVNSLKAGYRNAVITKEIV